MTESHKIGLVLGSGAARGWVHKGALVALDELGITPDVITGCSAGALVASARLLDILPAFEKWARELGPLGALKDFAFGLGKAGIIDPTRAFESFREYDRKIEDLSLPFGMTATDLVTGEEVRLTSGSVLDAARASSSIPMLFHAAKMPAEDGSRWLVDGALTNPVPVDLALELGATKTIAIDLQAHSRTLERFVGPRTRALVVVEEPEVPQHDVIPHQVMELIHRTQSFVERQMALAKSRMDAEPHFMETVIATSDIYQTHLARAKLALCPPDVLIAPDTRNFPPTAFDQPDEMTALGYQSVMDQKDELLALKQGS
ncbi:MAG: patatin-like phospholipase family protein [Aquisalinus sp.]|nr:patatin-like phospholipase family protein [Aquisalinus sp.]